MNAVADDALSRLTALKDQWLHHYGQSLLIQRAGAALATGLAPEQYVTPMPGSVTTVNYHGAPMPDATPAAPAAPAPAAPVAPAAPGIVGRVLPWALSAALAAAGVGGLAGYFLAPKAATPPPAATTQTPAAPIGKPQEYQVQWKLGPDGKWQTSVTPVPVEP